MVASVVAVGVDVVAGDQVVASFADDGDGLGGHEDQYGCGCVFSADAEVVQAAAVAQGELAALVSGVVADAEVFVGAGGGGFGQGVVDGVWCGAGVVGAVRALGVVDRGEGVEQFLQFGQCRGTPVLAEPEFEGSVEALNFPWVWWWPG